MSTLLLFLLLAITATVLLHRDLKQADRRRRMRLMTAPMRRAFEGLRATIGLAITPALAEAVRAANELDTAMRRVRVTLIADTSQFESALRRAQERLRGGEDR